MLSLYWASTGGDSWRYIGEPLGIIGWHTHGLFLVYISFFMFVVVNAVTALIVQSTILMGESDHAKDVQEEIKKRNDYIDVVKQMFCIVDEDHNGELSWGEFQRVLLHNDDEVMSFAKSLRFDIDDLKTVFTLLSQHGERTVKVEAFVDGCIKLRGVAKSTDLQCVLHCNERMEEQLTRMELLLNKDMPEQLTCRAIDTRAAGG
eukprot:gnl/TRDRNA2_/TRDRNA2_176687_c12_seq3.p1 gnl/TRDRNA2_/TRDRNA2_176687_c12~~gnl/TRDRNA2_/TRDRNA2_176687_c12_seq3.p1  ORF type:complete len:204 (-),score=35.07 gnl/TRDRNA2_/TRDRNA2_176687_c12_seq3:392-1003(-)